MVFKTRKIPKYLIIREEYEIRKKPRFGVLRMLMVSVTVGALAYVLSVGMAQL